MKELFPRTIVGGLSLPRMLIGTNWMFGYSHTGPAADHTITRAFASEEDFLPIVRTFMDNGIDAIMGPISTSPLASRAMLHVQERLGRRLLIIDTPIFNVDDTAQARAEAQAVIENSARLGSTFCLVHHWCAEQLVNKNKSTMDRLPDYLSMIRESGMHPGVTAHMPELVTYCDENEYDVETYVQIFNCVGFMMQVEIESVIRLIHGAKHPVMTIKPMGAGRTTPYVGLTFNWNVLREQDMVTVGCFNELEAMEDIEISRAALEHRLPDVNKRSSPAVEQTALQ